MGFYRMWSEISEALVSKFDCSYFVAYQAGRYMAEDAIDRGAVFNNLDSEHLKERIADLMREVNTGTGPTPSKTKPQPKPRLQQGARRVPLREWIAQRRWVQ